MTNKKAKTIIVDMDGVLCNMGELWYDHLTMRYNISEYGREWILANGLNSCGPLLPYNLALMFDIPEGDDHMAFWKSCTLYEGVQPMEGSVEALKELKAKGYEIFIASRCTGNHSKSKCKWLRQHFGFVDGIFLTGKNPKEKAYLVRNADWFIDDSAEQILAIEDEHKHKCIHFITDFIQEAIREVQKNPDIKTACDWAGVLKTIYRYDNNEE